MALNAAVSMGVSVIITGLISAFTAWINKSEEIAQKAQEAADKINSINDSLKTNTETVENAKRRYAELAQEVENLGKTNQSRGSLNNDEYEEFLDLSNQLAGVFPTLKKRYDENGNAILDLSGDVNTIVGSLDDLIKKEQELANQKIMEEFPDVFSGFTQDLKNAKQEVKSAQSEFDKINNAYQDLANGGMTSQAFDTQGNGWFTNANGEKVTVALAEYISNLEALGIAYEKTNIMVKNQFGGDQLSGYLVEATGDINTAFTSKLETARNNLQYAKQQLEGEASSINQYLNTWLQTEFSYNQIEDAGLQDAIQQTLFNFDWDSLPDNIDKNDWAEVSEYLRKNVLFAINNVQDNPEISKALSDLFTNQELSPEQKNNLIKQIQDYFGKDNPISIFLQPQFEENETTQKNIDKAIADAQKKFDKSEVKKQLEEFNKDDTIDFTIRPKVDTSELEKAGWGEQEPGTATVYSVTGYSEDYGLDAGKAVVVTPILPDGTVLSPEQVDEYIRKILTGEKVDVDIKMGVFDGENYKTEADEFANTIHELHQKYFLDNSYVDWNKYFEEQSINTQEEVDKWNEVTEGAKTAAEAMDMWANAKKNVNKTTVSLSEMEKASDKIGKLSSAFKELSDDGYITTKTLGEIKTATGLADDEWAEYENKLLNAKKGSADFNQVLSELTYKILENEFATIDLTNATDEEITAIENKIAATLRESGVENANAVAHEYVGIARVNAAIAAYDGTQASYDSAAALISESLSAEQAKVAMNQLELAKRNVNNAKITSSDDIDNIIAIANAALASEQTLKDLARAKAELAEGFVGPVSKSTMDMMNGSYDFEFDKLDPSDFRVSAPRYSGGSSSKGSGSGSSSKEDAANYKDSTEAVINRINLRATELKQDEELINSKLDLIDTETEYAEAIKLTNSLISNQKLRKEELIKANNQISHEAQYLRDSNPYDEDSWFNSQGEATEAYYSLLNSVGTGTEQEKIETLFEQIQKYKKAYLENEKEIRDVDKDIFENIKKISDYARNALEKQFKERTEDSERWISTEESLDKLNTKEKLAAYKRIIAYHDDFLKQIETDENLSAKDRDELWKEYYDQREDYAIKVYETEREIVDNASSELERIISLETKNLQRKNEELDKSLTKEQKILEIMNSRYDILDKLAEAEHESDKAILESRRSKEYLSPAEYNLLFNEEDYLETKDKIKTLRNESEKLSLDFTAQINKAYAENNLYLAEAITSEYQRQLALKERELEILQREIDLEKKQQQLNNVLAEKNVKFLNKQGQWEWVADLDKVNQAEEDLAEAKYVYDKAVEEKNKQLAINLQESVISNIETSMGENDKKIQELEDTIELITEKVDLLQNPIQDITGLVTELAYKGIAGMNAALGNLLTMLSEVTGVQYDIPSYIPTSYQLLESTSDLKNVTSLYASEKPQTTFNGVTFDKNFDYQDLINKEKALDYPDSFKLMELIKKREAKLAWIKEYGLSGYALGTKKAQPGLSWVDESGQETYVTSHGVLHNFIGGEMVFNPEQTKNLWELSNIDYSKMFSPQIINMDSLSFKKPEVQNRSYFEGANINVYNPADFNDFMRQMNDAIKNKKV